MKHRSMQLAVLGLLFWFSCAPFPDIPIDPISGQLPDNEPTETNSEDTQVDFSASDSTPVTDGDSSETVRNESSESLPPPVPEPETLVINELYYDAPGGDTDGVLFVELFGTESSAIGGYQLRFVNGDNGDVTEVIELAEDSELREDGFFVIVDGRTGALDTTQVSDFDFIDNFDPQNGPDGVQLIDRNGGLLDSVAYGEGSVATSSDGLPLGEGLPAIDVAAGHSLARDPLGTDTDDNAFDFIENILPSPGTSDVDELLSEEPI
jgi:hypothetical protein